MTVVDIFKDKEGRYAYFECSGHADDNAVEGEDIICAAISMLVINTINSLEVLAGADITYAAAEEGGELSCRFFDSPPMKKLHFSLTVWSWGLQKCQGNVRRGVSRYSSQGGMNHDESQSSVLRA